MRFGAQPWSQATDWPGLRDVALDQIVKYLFHSEQSRAMVRVVQADWRA
jgi:hypothetical protein